jgi:RNA polymerase sigma factor (sigma-70 family)
MRTEDGNIVHQCLNGEPGAFGMLVDKYKEGIYAFAYDKLRDFQDAQDVTQEVFLQAYRGLRTLRRWESLAFWLYRIAYARCTDLLRIRSKRADRDFIEDQDPQVIDAPSLDSYRRDQQDESLQGALDSLPDAYREVLVLHYFGGMTIKDMANALGVSPGAIGMRLSRARAQLREEMIAMMDTTFEGQRLPTGFTFRIVEAVKSIKIDPMPRMGGLPWGVSLAAGVIVAVLSLNPRMSIPNDISIPTGAPPPVEARVLKAGEISVDIMKTDEISVISSKQGDGVGKEPQFQSLQNALMLAPPAGEDTWTKRADMPTNRIQLSISEVNGRIYVIGGSGAGVVSSTVEEYDPAADKWTRKADMPTPRYFLATAVVNGRIYAIGGEKRDGVFSTVEEYDPVTDTWTKKADLPTPRTCLSACTANGKIYAIGGIVPQANPFVATVEEYDPEIDKWTRKSDMPTARSSVCTSLVNGKIYAIGGLPGKWPPTSAVEKYDPVSDTWTKKADMITARTYFTTVVINGRILALGGTSDWPNGDAILATTMEEYDPVTDKWTEKGDMLTPRMYCPASLVNDKVYVIGGLSAKNQIMKTVEEYNPNASGESIEPKGKLPTTWGDVRTVLNR